MSPVIEMKNTGTKDPLQTLDGIPESWRKGMTLGAQLYLDNLQSAYNQLKTAIPTT